VETYPRSSDIIKERVPANMIREVGSRYGLFLKALSKIIGVETSAIYRKQGTLNRNISKHLLQLDRLLKIAIEYFGCEPNAHAWFFRYNRDLVSEPIYLCNTLHGV
jgi:uncharacterized protein (DUF2384 family)